MKIARRSWILLGIALLLLVCAGLMAYLRTQHFRELVRESIRERVEDATGLECHIDKLELDFFSGRFEVEGFEMHARPGAANLFRVEVSEARGHFRWISFLRPRIDLRELRLVRPRVVISVQRDSRGVDPEVLNRMIHDSLEFGAKEVSLENGWVEIDNQRIPVNLKLADLECAIRYLPEKPAYAIRLAYRNGSVEWAGRNLTYDVDSSLRLGPTGIDVEALTVRRPKLNLRGSGWLRDWRNPVVLLQGEGSIQAAELGIVHPDLRAARGEISVAGNFRWAAEGFHSMGKFRLEHGLFRQVEADAISGLFEVIPGTFRISNAQGRIGTASLQARADLQFHPLRSRPHIVNLMTQGPILPALAKLFNLPAIAFENPVETTTEIRWISGKTDLDLTSSLTLHALPGSGGSTTGFRSELDGEAEISYREGSVRVTRADLHSQSTVIRAASVAASRFELKLHTSRIAEPLGLLSAISPKSARLLEENPDLRQASGTFDFDGSVAIASPEKAEIRGVVKVSGGRWRSYRADSLSAAAVFDGENLELQSLRAQRGEENIDGDLSGRFSLSSEVQPEFSFQGSAQNVSLNSLRELGIDIPGEITGIASGKGNIALRAGQWHVKGDLELTKAELYGEPLDLARGHADLAEGVLRISGGNAQRGAARLLTQGTYSIDSGQIEMKIRATSVPLKDLPAIRDSKLDVGGLISADGELRGTMDNPSVRASYEISGFRYGTYEFGAGKGALELEDRKLKGSGSVRSDLGDFTIQAEISTTTGFSGTANVRATRWNMRPFLTQDLPPSVNEISTALEGDLKIEGKFAEPASLVYHGELDGASAKIHDYELRNEGKILFEISGQKLRLERCKVQGVGSDLTLSGEIPIDETAALNLRLKGALNLKFLEHAEMKLSVSGSATLDVHATGTLSNPQIIGKAQLQNCRVQNSDLAYPLSSLEGLITFSRYTVRLENLRGRVASGTVTISGLLEHQNGELRSINLQAQARDSRLAYPKDFQTTLDANLNLRGGRDAQVLSGDIHVIRAEYLRDFNLLEQLAGRSPTAAGSPVANPALEGVRFNVNIESADGLHVDNELMRIQGRIHLTLRGTPGYPLLTGRVEANEGSIFFRGSRFEIVSASADFMDQSRINPIFEIRAEADVKSYRLILDVSGDLDKLRSNLRSDPPLATMDIVTLLATGRERNDTQDSRRQAEITGVSAASILSESLTGVIGKRVQRLFGFESFRVDPFLAGADGDPTARVTVSQRLSKEFAVTFSRNLSTNEEQVIIVEYDVSRNFSILATRDENGKFAVDFRFRKRFK